LDSLKEYINTAKAHSTIKSMPVVRVISDGWRHLEREETAEI